MWLWQRQCSSMKWKWKMPGSQKLIGCKNGRQNEWLNEGTRVTSHIYLHGTSDHEWTMVHHNGDVP